MTTVKVTVNGHLVEVDAMVKEGVFLVNLTPHQLDMLTGNDYVVPVSGILCRVVEITSAAQRGPLGLILDKSFGAVADLPEAQDGVYYVVSRPTIQALLALGIRREDVIVPDGFVRRDGQIIGATGFARIS